MARASANMHGWPGWRGCAAASSPPGSCLRGGQVVGIGPFGAMAFRGYGNSMRGDRPAAALDVDACRAFVARVGVTSTAEAPRGARRITHYIESLTSGGAERQMCNIAI